MAVLLGQQRMAEAEPVAQRALEAAERLPTAGPQHADRNANLHGLATVHAALGRSSDAQPPLARAHLQVAMASCETRLAAVLAELGKLAEQR